METGMETQYYSRTWLAGLLVFLAILKHYFKNNRRKDPRCPPGPKPLPLIGNLLQLGLRKESQTVLRKWAKEYGPAYTLKMGSDDVIVLSDPKLIREVYQDSSSSGRSPNPVFVAMSGEYGLLMSEVTQWEELRRFTIRKLRELGFAKTSMEGMITREANCMLEWFRERLGRPISGDNIFHGAVINSLWSMMSGERCDWNSGTEVPPIIKYSVDAMCALNQMTGTGMIFAPSMRHIAPGYFGWTKWITSQAGLDRIINATLAKHKKNLDKKEPKNLIDHFLVEIDNQTQSRNLTSIFYMERGESNLRAIIKEFFMAGSDTTSTTLSWILLLLANYPSVQKKLQEEIDQIVGPDRQPGLSDRTRMLYTEAFIYEVLRFTSISVNGVPHCMIKDAVFQNYFFPEGTTLMTNFVLVHYDKEVWGDPENFRPERFLNEDGSSLVKYEAFMPFSLGKRQCPGMPVAYDSLFLFTTTIFQKLEVKMDPTDDGSAMRNIIPKNKIENHPEPFRIIINERGQQ